jgi:hypothetical protein
LLTLWFDVVALAPDMVILLLLSTIKAYPEALRAIHNQKIWE